MAKSDLMKKILKNSNNPYINALEDSEFLNRDDPIITHIPAMNLILSGKIDGGFDSGIVSIAGKSKHFKSFFALHMAKAFLKKNPDGLIVFFDSEFGSPIKYFKLVMGDEYDPDKFVHAPVLSVEDLRSQMLNMLESSERGDKLMFIVDSVGNLASMKETEDTLDGKNTVDMTRAKALKSMFRLITPRLTMKNIPLVNINHTYQCGTKEMLVKTPHGNISLAKLKVGDDVYTTNGVESVSFAVKHEDANITDIELDNGDILSFVGDHRFLVNSEWVYVHDLKVGDILDEY